MQYHSGENSKHSKLGWIYVLQELTVRYTLTEQTLEEVGSSQLVLLRQQSQKESFLSYTGNVRLQN